MEHWTDDHIIWSFDEMMYIAYDEAGLEHSKHLTKNDARDALINYEKELDKGD